MKIASAAVLTCTGLACVLGGCTVGPDFVRPEPAPVTRYTATPLGPTVATPGSPGGEPQSFVEGEDIPARWWELFHSTALNALVERALTKSSGLKAAEAALALAHENLLVQRAAYYPAIAGSFTANHAKSSADLSPTPSSGALLYSLYTPAVSVAFVPDVFGLNRRLLESLQAQQQQSRFQLEAAYLALSSNVVVSAIQEAALRAQIVAARAAIDLNERSLAILRQQKAHGYASQLDVVTQEAQLAQARAALPPLLKQLTQQRNLLAILAGALPSEGLPEEFEFSQLQLPRELPLSLPSRLIEHRPDVRQAEENLHAACAQIGVAVANRLPNLTLTADAGQSALTLGALTASGEGFWDLGAVVTQPIFQGGALMHKERAAREAYQEAREQYRATVLVAFQNVADTLAALEHDATALQTATASAQAAEAAVELVRAQQRAGYANSLQLISAEQTVQSAILAKVQAQFNRYADTAALFQALGGGWWNRPDAAAATDGRAKESGTSRMRPARQQ
jgi:NodT family efflux transporter outer membrane factor (OMF) lipoprotein